MKNKWWINQLIVFYSFIDVEGMEIGQTYKIRYIIQTEFGLGVILYDQPSSRIFLTHLFMPKLDYLEHEQKVYELFYNN